MSDTTISFTIQGDNEDTLLLLARIVIRTSNCRRENIRTKKNPSLICFARTADYQKKTGFYSEDVLEKARELATNYAIEELNKAFGKMARSVNRKKGIIKMTYKPLKKVNVRELKENDTQEVEFQCGNCNHHTKVLYCAGASKIFCPYCGVDI